MTSREKTLGLIFLATLVVAGCLWLGEAYLETTQRVDAELRATERTLTGYELALKNRDLGLGKKSPWTAKEAVDEVFLEKLDGTARKAGWRLDSAVLKSKKEKTALFLVRLEGRGDAWATLLDALSRWDRPIVLNALEAAATGKGRMEAQLEIGYESP